MISSAFNTVDMFSTYVWHVHNVETLLKLFLGIWGHQLRTFFEIIALLSFPHLSLIVSPQTRILGFQIQNLRAQNQNLPDKSKGFELPVTIDIGSYIFKAGTNVAMNILMYVTWGLTLLHMQPMWLCNLSGGQFEDTFDNTHSGEKSNKCNQCNYASVLRSNFRTHLKTHSGEN